MGVLLELAEKIDVVFLLVMAAACACCILLLPMAVAAQEGNVPNDGAYAEATAPVGMGAEIMTPVTTSVGFPPTANAATTADRSYPRNLIGNGSFEQGISYWQPSRDTVRVEVVSSALYDTNVTPDGRKAMRIDKTDSKTFSLRQTLSTAIRQGESYILSAWVRTENFSAAGARLAVITDRWSWEGALPLPSGTTGWQRVSVSLAIPRSPTYQVLLFLPTGAKGIVWLDAIQLEQGMDMSDYAETILPALQLASTLDGLLAQVTAREAVVAKVAGVSGVSGATGVGGVGGVGDPSSPLQEQEQSAREIQARLSAVLNASNSSQANNAWDVLLEANVPDKVIKLTKTIAEGNLLIGSQSPWQEKWPPSVSAQTQSIASISLQAYSGERVDASLLLTNLATSTAYLRVKCDQYTGILLPEPERRQWQQASKVLHQNLVSDSDQPIQTVQPQQVLTVREAMPIAAQADGTLVADVLPLLNQAGVLTLPSAESRELFLTFDTTTLAPGVYRSTLHLIPTTGGTERQIRVEIKVLPLRIGAATEGGYPRLSPWGVVSENPQAVSTPVDYLADAVNHGLNVFMLSPNLVLPALNADGSLRNSIDFSEADRRLRVFQQAVEGAQPFYVGYYSIASAFKTHAAKFGIAYPSAAFDRAFQNWMRAWINHLLLELGLSYTDFAFELRDEPNEPDEFGLFMYTAKLLRSVDARAQILLTVNFRDMAMLERAKPYTDIWVALGDIMVHSDVAEFLRKTGAEVWLYQCSRRAKALNPQGYYRIQGWMAHQYKFNGWGFYTWLSTNEDTWALNREGNNYSAVYVTPTGPVASRRGEAWRRGNDDHRILQMFASLVQQAEAQGVAAQSVREARQVVEEAIQVVLNNVDYARTYDLAANQIATFDDALQVVREQILRLVTHLAETANQTAAS